MGKDYKVQSFTKGDFQDTNGNFWCEANLQEVESGVLEDRVKWVVKDPMTVKEDDIVFGRIEEKTSKAGKPYARFYREQNPEQQHLTGTTAPKKEWQPRDDDAIRAQWALGQAVQLQHALAERRNDNALLNAEHVEETAKWFFKAVERVKGSDFNTGSQPSIAASQGIKEQTAPAASGYDKFKASRPQPKDLVISEVEDEQSLYNSIAIAEASMNSEVHTGEVHT